MNEKTVLVLRTSDKDGTAFGGFKWPKSGMVECPDWNPKAECGNGLHGILWPEGDWSNIKEYDQPIWQVVKVLELDIVKIGGKVKFPRGEVIYSGEFAIAFNMIAKAFISDLPNLIPNLQKNCKNYLSDNGGKYARIGSSGNSAQIGSSGDSARIGSSGDDARIGSSGDDARIGSSGDDARIGSSGNSARIGSSGKYARIGSSGNSAQIGSSGYYARIGSSGDDARIGSSGDDAQIESTGKNSVIACSGSVSKFKAGENGCISAPWHDGKRIRFAVGYVGENIKQDTWYKISNNGEFVEIG